MTVKVSASERRGIAIGAIMEQYQDMRHEPLDAKVRVEIQGRIGQLHTMGRTERWHNAVSNWARMVRTEPNLHWAIMQGGVYAMHAS